MRLLKTVVRSDYADLIFIFLCVLDHVFMRHLITTDFISGIWTHYAQLTSSWTMWNHLFWAISKRACTPSCLKKNFCSQNKNLIYVYIWILKHHICTPTIAMWNNTKFIAHLPIETLVKHAIDIEILLLNNPNIEDKCQYTRGWDFQAWITSSTFKYVTK